MKFMSNIVQFLFVMTMRCLLNIKFFVSGKGVCALIRLSRSRRLARDSCSSLAISSEMFKLTSDLWHTPHAMFNSRGYFMLFKERIVYQIALSQKVDNVDTDI